MRHTKTPDDSGWYWILDYDGEASMVHLQHEYAAGDDTVLTHMELTESLAVAFDRYVEVEGGWHPVLMFEGKLEKNQVYGVWRGPKFWMGPLQCPFDEFSRYTAEFPADMHEEAAEKEEALVMVCVDLTHCQASGGVITNLGFMPADAAMDAGAKAFNRDTK